VLQGTAETLVGEIPPVLTAGTMFGMTRRMSRRVL